MKYVFGPVPSRRLGQSLGIDPLPFKTCNWNCVYCQLGRTSPLTLERKEFVPRQDLINEVQQKLDTSQTGEIDWVTFVGSGEPTLHSSLGWMIQQVKTHTVLPVAVITNGSLLYLPDIRDELSAADAVLPTLDAGNSKLYRRINRAAPRFSFERLVDGIETFRKNYSGKLWIETMLIKSMNDSVEALHEIAHILERLNPDAIHITLPIRPPAEASIRPSDNAGLLRAEDILGKVAPVRMPDYDETKSIGDGDLLELIISIVTRHPMQEDDLLILLDCWSADEIHAGLKSLSNDHKITTQEMDGAHFWISSAASFHGEKTVVK